ncbi:MAG: hypothetical protein ACRCYQ_07500 [Nocardioides sp.]
MQSRLTAPRPRLARTSLSVALTVGALAAGSLAPHPAAASAAAAPPTLNPPTAAAADWLAGELTDGLIVNPTFGGFNDYGLSIDTGFALAEIGRRAPVLAEVRMAVAENVKSYTTGVDFGSDDVYASAVAKAAAFAERSGDDPAAYGGVDLIDQLDGLVSGSAPIAGRIEDAPETGTDDFANVIGQAFAVEALIRQDHPKADSALEFLLQQQCGDGYFRLMFNADKSAADQSCNGGTADESAADTDVTALVLLSLQRSGTSAAPATEAMDKAVAWLKSTQAADGSWGGGPATEKPNTNSTGLAGWALGVAGKTKAAAKAAAFVRRHQSVFRRACNKPLARHNGAIAYDLAAFKVARKDGITDETSDQWRRATTQAAPVLTYAKTRPGAPRLQPPRRVVRAGQRVKLEVTRLEMGERICLVNKRTKKGKSRVADAGVERISIKPARAGRVKYCVYSIRGRDCVVVRVRGR